MHHPCTLATFSLLPEDLRVQHFLLHCEHFLQTTFLPRTTPLVSTPGLRFAIETPSTIPKAIKTVDLCCLVARLHAHSCITAICPMRFAAYSTLLSHFRYCTLQREDIALTSFTLPSNNRLDFCNSYSVTTQAFNKSNQSSKQTFKMPLSTKQMEYLALAWYVHHRIVAT